MRTPSYRSHTSRLAWLRAIVGAGALVVAFAALVAGAAHADPQGASQPKTHFIRKISGPTPAPLRGCGLNPAGEGSETSPILAVDPTATRNLIAYFIQSDQAADVVSVSHDNGNSWTEVVIPGQTLCTGGSAFFAFDPSVSFGGDGRAYVATPLVDIVFCDGTNPACGSEDFPFFDIVWRLQANSSADSGDSWSSPVEIDVAGPYPHLALDFPTITGDPVRPRTAYLNWNRALDFLGAGGQSEEMLSKTTDGGATWSTPVKLPIPPAPDDFIFGGQVHVLPDGTLVSTYLQWPNFVVPPPASFRLIRSTDGADTWSAPILVAGTPASTLRDPESLEILSPLFSVNPPSYAVGPSGEIYGTWSEIDSLTSSRILVVDSQDGGLTWSAPRALKVSSSQVLKPTVAVSEDGTIGVMYLDFRSDVAGDPVLSTDVWFSASIDGGHSWVESHVFGPFDYRSIPASGANATAIGDTFGLVAIGRNRFGAAFPAVLDDPTNGVTDIFFASIRLVRAPKLMGGRSCPQFIEPRPDALSAAEPARHLDRFESCLGDGE